MNIAAIRKIAILIALFAGVSVGLFAQEKNDAIKVFNEGVELMKANDVNAIATFENCIKICEQIGDSANDIKVKAIKVLPDLYFQKAFDLLTIDKNIQASLKASKKTLEIAEKYEDNKTKESTQKIMIQAYSTMASTFVTNKEYLKAIQAYDSVLMINPDHIPSIFNKILVYKGLDDAPKFAESIDLYIEKLKSTGDSAKIGQANQIARDYFRIAGGKANQANKVTDAFNLLNMASQYGADKNLYYQYASVYNKQKKYALAVENAKKGLDLETGTPEAKAKYYYELGSAQAGKGETANACESFKNALYGPFLQAAKAQRTNMKCP
jgi:tetratricopeptide (TPR) repeat protein